MNMKPQTKNTLLMAVIFLAVFNVFLWWRIFSGVSIEHPEIYFFDIGQGDSQLLVLPGGVKILIDGGPSGERLTARLNEILPASDRYIDLVILSHPQHDHYAGFISALKYYQAGAFISTGAEGTAKSFADLRQVLKDGKVRQINLLEGDRIRYKNYDLEILSPPAEFLNHPDLNDGSLAVFLKTGSSTALFTGDIGFLVEDYLVKRHNIDADILKVPHHGSKYSSGENFLSAVTPQISIIEVGRNSYGHPTEAALSRLKNAGSRIYRTDQDGTVKLVIKGGKVGVFKKVSKIK